MVRIGYIVGSFAEDSVNRKLAELLVAQAPERAELAEIDIRPLPLYDRHLDAEFPEEMSAFKKEAAAVDGLLLVSPEHNQSFPAPVKNALDILTRPPKQGVLAGTPMGIAGASPSRFGTINGQTQLRSFLPLLGVKLMGTPLMAVQVTEGTFAEDGADAALVRRAAKYMDALTTWVEQHS
ncbi:NAD(P)H-dependent oxidoreductase [Nesterenkonia sp. HG001]|uniref:NADPH-dependent FMN reductase n=1 Tax=Nesterenkonia sp. HG001 TaxID=2983207 RepID=UPI002AC7603F|nr:NAD(P)H-dependent oxidoreductase [Nesterenkonia sp. HG001]MDZ5077251.1 NAD(P)H-dependent oxidoreductase [Nesterenkonia sp. HG001]